MTLKKQVESVLRDSPETRNSDGLLIIRLYERYFYLSETIQKSKLLEIMNYAKPDDIVRYRRKFNQAKLFLPDSIIQEKRQERIETMRQDLGYNNYNYL